MNKEFKPYLYIALIFLCLWGFSGLISGKGFFGEIAEQFGAFGSLLFLLLKLVISLGAIALIIYVIALIRNKK